LSPDARFLRVGVIVGVVSAVIDVTVGHQFVQVSVRPDIMVLDHGHVIVRKVQEILLWPDISLRQLGGIQDDGVLRLDLGRQLEGALMFQDRTLGMTVGGDPHLLWVACQDDIGGEVPAAADCLLICFLGSDVHDEALPADGDEVLLEMVGIPAVASKALARFVCHVYYYSGYF